MDLSLSEQQEMLKRMARDFLADKCTPKYVRQMETDERGHSLELWREMAELGFMSLAFPEQYGGGGMSFIDMVVLLEEMGRACLPGPLFSTVITCGLLILNIGSEAQKQELLPKIASGEMILSLALSEAEADYDKDYFSVTATPDKDAYIINGTKLFVPHAHIADYLICLTRTKASANRKPEINIFLVDAKNAGISKTPLKTIAADKQYEVTFTNVRVPMTNILGKENQSWPEIDRVLQFAAVAKCAEMIGGAQRVLEMTTDYATDRIQFGHPIGSFQAIQHHCANMLIDVHTSRWITYQAACKLAEGAPCTKEASVAKSWVDQAYRRVCMLAHQVHGAIGFTEDHDLQLYTKRAKAAEVAFGDADFHREIVAREIGL
jgi:alkylation response protein AidB-like acyl-CoA dehydrogenase